MTNLLINEISWISYVIASFFIVIFEEECQNEMIS